MRYKISFGYGDEQQFNGTIELSESDIDRMERFHKAAMRLRRCRMVSDELLYQQAQHDIINDIILYPPVIPESDLVHFITYLRPFMYERDLPYFKAVSNICFRDLDHIPEIAAFNESIQNSFNGKTVDEKIALARKHIERHELYKSGAINRLGGGDGWLYALQFGYIKEADTKFVEAWLYGEMFHQKIDRVDLWDEIVKTHDEQSIHSAIRGNLLHIYQSVASLNNFIVRILYCVEHQEEI